jgi:SNF2 family DNA or RNA helicase
MYPNKNHSFTVPVGNASRQLIDIDSPEVKEVRKVRIVQESPVTPSASSPVIVSNVSSHYSPQVELSSLVQPTPVPLKTSAIELIPERDDPLPSKKHKEENSESDSDCDIIDLTVSVPIVESQIPTPPVPKSSTEAPDKSYGHNRVQMIKIEAPTDMNPKAKEAFASPRKPPKKGKRNLQNQVPFSQMSGSSSINPFDDDEDDEDQWLQRLQTWSNDMALASRLEEDYAKKVIEMIPLEETLEDELETIRQKLVAENGGNGTPRGLSIQLLDHQIIGLCWMMRMERNDNFKGGILADEMGVVDPNPDGQDNTDSSITSSKSIVS